MKPKFEKVSDSDHNLLVDLKRKRDAQSETYFAGASRLALPLQSTVSSPVRKIGKRRKVDGLGCKCSGIACHQRISLLKYYLNFKKSGSPQRLMYYENGDWKNFSQDIVSLVKKDLQLKKAVLEVVFDGHPIVLDFLHMMRLDLKTGLQQPIAWIDEADNCFFPEIFSNLDKNGHSDLGPNRSNDIKLQLEIQIAGSGNLTFDKSNGESNCIVGQVQLYQKPEVTDYDQVDDSCVKVADESMDEVSAENQLTGENMVSGFNSMHRDLDSDVVKDMFLKGIGSSAKVKIVEVYSGSSNFVQGRQELFQKQVEITKKYRGDANIRFAWLPSSKEALPIIMRYGFSHFGPSKTTMSNFGNGIHLAPADCIGSSASDCDVDENGVQYIVLCSVIMGSMELVHPGSEQFHPSSEDFDNGVDDLENPKHYIVWHMNKNTHVLPEYVVRFKGFSDPDSFEVLHACLTGVLTGKESKFDSSGVTICQEFQTDFGGGCRQMSSVRAPASPAKLVPGPAKPPTSPWMSFSMLLNAISDKIPPESLDLVKIYHNKFTAKRISRRAFIQELRSIVGDPLLRSILVNSPCKIPPNATESDTSKVQEMKFRQPVD